MSEKETILSLIQEINFAWLRGDFSKMESCFHQDFTIAQPGLGKFEKGREKCIESYKNFMRIAQILNYEETEHTVEVWGDTAVANYRFVMEYELEGKVYNDKGADLFVLNNSNGSWQAVWRTVIM